MKRRWRRGAACAALGAAVLSASAQAPAPGNAPSRPTVEQKAQLVKRLISDSPATARIEASGSEEARAHFRAAAERHGRALQRLEAGELAQADAELNEAMWMVGKARQLVPDPMQRAIELRVQNRNMALAIDSLRASYQAHLARTPGLASSAGGDATLARVAARLEEAQGFSNSEHVREAHAILQEVERELMVALSRALGTTVDYTQRFASPAEEYAFEAARNRSFQELLPIARAELRPGPDALAQMQRLVALNAALVERAARSAAQHQYGPALEALRQGTGHLQSALHAAGLVMPREVAATGAPR